MSSRSMSLVLAALAVTLAPGALGAPRPSGSTPEYTMIQLADLGAGGDVKHASETSAAMRVVGRVNSGSWEDAQGQTCRLLQPAIWDVTGSVNPVQPQLLEAPVPGKPAHVTVSSPDGKWLGGDFFDGAASGMCAWFMAPAVWNQSSAGTWTVTALPAPDGYQNGSVTGIVDGGAVIFGDATRPILLGDGSTRYVTRPVVWRRSTSSGAHVPELLPCGSCDEYSLAPPPRLRADGTVAAGRVKLDGTGPGSEPYVPAFWAHSEGSWSFSPLPELATGLGGDAAPGHDGSFFGEAALNGLGLRHAVRWESAIAAPRDLGALDPARSSGAVDQNGAGTLVGWSETTVRNTAESRAARWTAGTWQLADLNTMASTDGWILRDATAIDSAGRIAGGMDKVVSRRTVRGRYVLIPTGN